ncbi:hypothetical protein B566_EDAN014961 [Ephemera danica]|nr:hypothetical protein B566_EDAN014961 [Ephemera danica]
MQSVVIAEDIDIPAMVSERKKKRLAPSASSAEADTTSAFDDKTEPPSPKKAKKSAGSSKKSTSKKSVKKEDEPKFWPEADLQELIRRIEQNIPPKDTLKFDSQARKLNWGAVAFGAYNASDCKGMWTHIQLRLRRFRLLRELVEDAKAWVSQPWTNFYRSQKLNRHPEQPRRPLSTYMLFYLEKKDKVAKENPSLEMTEISKKIALMYKNLPEKTKQKFVQKAAQMRQEYEVQIEAFHKQHPELVPKVSKREKSSSQTYPGPIKPKTPFQVCNSCPVFVIQLYFADKMENKHKNDPNASKTALTELYRLQWKTLSDKKKMYAGKPEKPPNSGYSLFSRIMLKSEEIKHYDSKQRMTQISAMWKNLNAKDKRKYHDKVQQLLEQYKLDFATYLESLPPDKKEEELQAGRRCKKPSTGQATRRRRIKKEQDDDDDEDDEVESSSEEDTDEEEETVQQPTPSSPKKDAAKTKKVKEEPTEKPPMKLFKGEPEPPPVMAYKLFLKKFMVEANHIPEANRMKEAPRYWQMLPDTEKTKYRKKLAELKQKYIANYEKFLKSLSQEELKEYSQQKAICKQSEESPEDSDDDEEEGEEEDSAAESDEEEDEVRVTGVVRTATFPSLPRRRHNSTDTEDSDSDGSSSGSASDTDSSESGSGSDSDSESD